MSSPAYLVDDVLAEILLRLPAECVLRCGAVSKRWRRVTKCPAFAAAYSRRRPLELLAYPEGFRIGPRARNPLAAVDPAGDPSRRRRLLRFHSPARLVGSCDGLLLFTHHNKSFLVCNPATRQWAGLPPRRGTNVMASGFYFHRPSGEHRVLCIYSAPVLYPFQSPSPEEMAATGRFHYVLSTGAGAEARKLGRVAKGGDDPFPSACVTLGATLYWLHHPEAGGSGSMVAFDTVSETFRRVSTPPTPPSTWQSRRQLRAFDMVGRLAVSAVEEGSRRMDVWALEDGGGGEGSCWSCILRIDDLPPLRHCQGLYCQSYEAVAVLEGGALVVVGGGWVVLYDVKDKRELSRVDHWGSVGNLSRWFYRESLAPLPQPDARPCPLAVPGDGEPLLHYDDDANVPLYGSRCDYEWIVPHDQL